jgi:hypothetical protein
MPGGRLFARDSPCFPGVALPRMHRLRGELLPVFRPPTFWVGGGGCLDSQLLAAQRLEVFIPQSPPRVERFCFYRTTLLFF